MFKGFFSVALKGSWWLVTLTGLISFGASFAGLTALANGWAAVVFPASSEKFLIVISAVVAALVSQGMTSLTGTLLVRRLRWKNKHMRTALDSMAQGLCMFDAAERLVVCNKQYSEMYGLTSDEVRPGSTLSEVLTRRVAKGTFSRDPQQYRQDFLSEIRQGRTMVHEVKSTGGRLLLVMNHPMKGGGWIG